MAAGLRAPFSRRLSLVWKGLDVDRYPFNLPILEGGRLSLEFDRPITIFVGENGTGKSTLLEAIAGQIGFASGGGSRDHRFDKADQPTLANALRLSWLPKVPNGFFFRAESFFNFARYIDELSGEWPAMRTDYGGRPLHDQSHGESFLALFENRLGSNRRAIYLLDEPEAALSPSRQIRFLRHLARAEASGNVQVILATHSPILMGYPTARLLSFDGARVHETTAPETSNYRELARYFADPAEFYREALAHPGDRDAGS
jgi:predicted ATPase